MTAPAVHKPRGFTKNLNLRLPVDEYENLRKEAREAGRSLHAHILWVLAHRPRRPSPEQVAFFESLAGSMPDSLT